MAARLVIVGGGIMGRCTAWAAVQWGVAGAPVGQRQIPNPLRSPGSFDRHRLIRYPYGAMRGYARMVRDAYAAWDRLWRDLGRTLYVESGTLVLSGAETGWARDSL